MKQLLKLLCLFIVTIIPFFPNFSHAQTIHGKITGRVVDKITKAPLPGANIVVMNTEPLLGSASDSSGRFSITHIPVGRYDVKVMYMGYETTIFPEVLVGSAKTTVLNADLKQSALLTDEVVVSATVAKDKPLNDMVLVSGRRFSVEEARRYAGGVDDPARLASAFAGVTTGLTEDNGIVIRGNAPKGILWRLEGIEIPNPNHFFGMTSFGGGGVSALSSMMLDNSDFLTGAFPAEYGNALSGVFDLRLKTGNTESHERTFQIGMMGIDLASEGPISKKNQSSYAFNYRYSTLGVVSHFISGEMNIPIYQDLSFKLNFPTQHAGIFSVWGLGFLDEIADHADEDTSAWNYEEDREEEKTNLQMGALGLSHKYIMGNNSYIHTTLAITSSGVTDDEWFVDREKNKTPFQYIDSRESQVIFASNLYHKFTARHYNKTGFSVHKMFYHINIDKDLDDILPLEPVVQEDGSSQFLSAYTQSDFRVADLWTLNAGVNVEYFSLNRDYAIEPRASLKWDFLHNQSISLGYGLHSRMEVLNIYMAQQQTAAGTVMPNRDLGFTRAHHIVLGYDIKLTDYTRLKIEPYYQYLYDVPVIPDSSYSLLNMDADWYFNQKLVNSGTGTNAGVEVTLERYLNNHYYYLATASFFSSKYKGGDGVERHTRYDRNYVINILGGKEWLLGRNRNKILGLSLRFQLLGGERRNALDMVRSLAEQDDVFDERNAFADRGPTTYHTFFTLTYRINSPGHSSIWALQLFNIPGSPDFEGYDYNYRTKRVDKSEVMVAFPILSYKLEF